MIWCSGCWPTPSLTFSWRTSPIATATPAAVHGRARPALYGRGLPALTVATLAAMAASLGLVFFYAPLEAEQGFLQKIFYVHVPLAIVALCGFMLGGLFAIQHLRTRETRWDLRSYVTIHISLIFAVGTLVTGSIWAKGSWGHWWVWSEPTLVSFLIIFLLYATYQPLRFAIEDPERQARYASVFAVTAGAFVPLNYVAVNLSTAYVHPRVFSSTSNLPGSMAFTLLVSLVATALLFATLCRYELTAKHARAQLRALRRQLSEERPAPRTRSAAPNLDRSEIDQQRRASAGAQPATAMTARGVPPSGAITAQSVGRSGA
jgi:heme exporter protein C